MMPGANVHEAKSRDTDSHLGWDYQREDDREEDGDPVSVQWWHRADEGKLFICRDDSSTVDWVEKFWNFHHLTLNCIFDSTNPLSGYQPSGERDVHRGGCPAHPLQVRQGAQGLQDASTGCLLYLSLKVVSSHGPVLPLDDEILSSGTGNNFCTWLNLRNGQPQQCTRWLDIFHNIQVWFVQCYPLLWWSL